MQQQQSPTQQQHQKILNALINAEQGELDATESEFLREHATYTQQLSNLDSQIQNLEVRIDNMRRQKSRFEGIAEYIMSKAVMYRFRKDQAAAAAAEEALPKEPKSAEQEGKADPGGEEKGKEAPKEAAPPRGKKGNGSVKEAPASA